MITDLIQDHNEESMMITGLPFSIMPKNNLSSEDEVESGEETISDQEESITREDMRCSISARGKEAITIIPSSAFLSRMVGLTTERTPSANDDEMAGLITKLISEEEGLNMWGALAERAGTLASISWLASHVPTCVLSRVGEETQRWNEGNRLPKGFLSSSSDNELHGNIIDSLDEYSLSDLSYSDGSESISSDSSESESTSSDSSGSESTSSDSSESSSLSSESSDSTGTEDLEDIGMDIGLDLDAMDEDPKGSAFLRLPHIRQRRSSRTSSGINSMGRDSFAGSRYSSQKSRGMRSLGKASVAASKERGRLSGPVSKYSAKSKTLTKSKTWSDFSHILPAQCRALSARRSVARSTTRSTARSACGGLSTFGESEDSSALKMPRIIGAAHKFAGGATNGEHSALFNQRFSNNDGSYNYQGQHQSPKRHSFMSRRACMDSLVNDHWETKTGMMNHGQKEEDIGLFKRSQNSSGNMSSLAQSRSRWRGSRRSVDFFPDGIDLPYASKHRSALLFIDISGFTRLSTLLDPESLSKAINTYFQQIVDLVTSQGGDILKFAGDAVFAEWKITSANSKRDENQVTMDRCVCAAATCAASIVAQCSDFPVSSQGMGNGAQVATLNVHCGLGLGELVGLHLGDHETRREYVVLGDPIDQVAEAEGAADLGEVAASPKFLAALAKNCRMQGGLASLAHHADKPVVIARRGVAFFTVNHNESRVDEWGCRGVERYTKNWNQEVLERYRNLLSLYAHPVVVANESAAVKNPQLKITAEERQREEAELRSVYVMFITPLISVRVTGNNEIDCANFQRLNNILNVTTRELSRFSGHLRQFIVDDKGVVLIATFGLRGSTSPNMVAEHALPATIVIHRVLQSELGVQTRIGATVGKCYCGVVGSVLRHEYAVLGPSVNLAARLMASPQNPGILVDENVRMLANRAFGFDALPPVVAKGYIDPVPIFEPLNPLERGWGRAKQNLVGRRTEIKESIEHARMLAMAPLPTRMIFLTGDSGMGKTTTVVHTIEHIRTILRPSRRRLIITKHVSIDSDYLIPFSMFGPILLDVLLQFEACSDERSIVSQEGGRCNINRRNSGRSLSNASRSFSQMQESTKSSDDTFSFIGKHSAVVERLRAICEDVDAPPEFAEIVSQHLQLVTDMNTPAQDDNSRSNEKATASSSLVSFMAKVFLRCTEESSLVLIALDNVHQTDEMSWKVIQELFETGTKLLIFCTSRPLSTYSLAVDKVFWSDLNDSYEKKGRFVKFDLEPLSKEEVLSMIAMSVNVHEDEVSEDVLNDVFTQSGGMPQYVNELMETAKRHHSVDVIQTENGSRTRRNSHLLKTPVYESLGQLILSRLDNLDANLRNILNLGAVLGGTFELTEVVDVLHQMYVEPQTKSQCDRVNETKIALDVAVKEGVLHVVYSCDDTIQSSCIPRSASNCAFNNGVKDSWSGSESFVDRLTYSFCHDIWRSTILKLMLSSRKRDIHKTIAETLECQQNGNSKDYISRMKEFSHWRASGNFLKAAGLALSIGNRFEVLGLNIHRIRLAEEAMAMWDESYSLEDAPGVLSRQVIESASVSEMELMIKLQVTVGKANANIHNAAESVKAYQTALRILEDSPVAEEMKDKSIVFPIFSGLFVAVKLGMIKQGPDLSFEKSLAARFVKETKSHGDPVHYLRALAMEAEIHGRLGEFELAFNAKREMERIYDPDEHSRAISEIYGSDRTAQAIGLSSLWYYQTGRIKDALHNCDRIISFVLPRMDLHNVHNSFLIIIPSLWVMKENGFGHEAGMNFEKYVTEPFHHYFPDGGFTYFLPVFKPITMLLDLASHSKIENQRSPDFNEYMEWALQGDNLRPSSILNSMGFLGLLPGTITSEICLLLAEKLKHGPDRVTLVKSGLAVASEALDYLAVNEMAFAEQSTRDTYDKLKQLDMPPMPVRGGQNVETQVPVK